MKQEVCKGLRCHPVAVVFNRDSFKSRSIGFEDDPARISVIRIGDELAQGRTGLAINAIGYACDNSLVSLQPCRDDLVAAMAITDFTYELPLVFDEGNRFSHLASDKLPPK